MMFSKVLAASLTAALTLSVAPLAHAADTFTAPSYPDPSCALTWGGTALGVTPDMAAQVVGLPVDVAGTPASQTLVVAELGESVDQAGVRAFLANCGLDPSTWTDLLWSGDSNPAYGGEATLDLTVVAAILPDNTTLKTATVDDGDFLHALINAGNACGLNGSDPTQWSRSQLDTPIGGCTVSMSFAIFEDSLADYLYYQLGLTTGAQRVRWFDEATAVLAGLAAAGVVTVVSSGDEGSGGCQPDTRGQQDRMAPQWPSTSSHVVSVGGTMWAPPAWNGAPITGGDPYAPGATLMPVTWRNWGIGSDCYWDYNSNVLWPGIGTTGGVSSLVSLPDFQSTAADHVGVSTGRLSPDLSALGGWPMWLVPTYNSPATPTLQFGTSAAAPLVAVGIAHVNAALTARGLRPIDNTGGPFDIHDALYSTAFSSMFNDVTEGSNNLWDPSIWSGPTAVTDPTTLENDVPGFLASGVNTSATITGYSAGTGYDLTTGLGVPNFATFASLMIAAQTAPYDPQGPPPVLQQVPAPDSGACDQITTEYDWGGSSAGGWSKSWAQWANDGQGGAVCTRTLIYNGALRHWMVQS